MPYTGGPVDHFKWMDHVGWEILSDSKLVAFVDGNEAYLLTLSSPCRVRPPPSTNVIRLTASSVYARLDSVSVNDWRCLVAEIRPIDLTRMRQDARARRATIAVAPPPSPPAAAAPVKPE